MALSQTPKTLLGLSVLFLVLGIGNLSFSSHKIEYYQKLLAEAQIKNAATTSGSPGTSSGSFTDSNFESNVSDQEHLKKLLSRLDYYQLANLGGSLFLALSAILFLLGLIYYQIPNCEEEAP